MASTEKVFLTFSPGNNRRLNRAFHSPRQAGPAKPFPQYILFYSSMAGKFRKGESLSLVFKMNIRNAVICLNRLCSPAHIPRLIMSVIIGESVQGKFLGRPFTHILKKIYKFSPTITDGNSSFPVMSIRRARWLAASGNHILPASICDCAPISGMPMFRFSSLFHNLILSFSLYRRGKGNAI